MKNDNLVSFFLDAINFFGKDSFTTLDAVLAAKSLDFSSAEKYFSNGEYVYWNMRSFLLAGAKVGALSFKDGRFCAVDVTARKKEWLQEIVQLFKFQNQSNKTEVDTAAQERQKKKAEELWKNFQPLPNRRGLLLVNRNYPLPEDYAPESLVVVYFLRPHFLQISEDFKMNRVAYEAANEMFIAAAQENLSGFLLLSAFRGRKEQEKIFKSAVTGYAALPGTSEHETGLAMDISAETGDDTFFEDTPHFDWLLKNSWRYGFILRYPEGKEKFTGVFYEPNHFRFVGRAAAKEIFERGLSFEEYCAEKGD